MVAGSSSAGCGGIIRDSHGDWVAGFTKFIGICSAYEAEEWTMISYGSCMGPTDLGFKHIIIESDAQELVGRVLDDNFVSGSLLVVRVSGSLLVVRIKEMRSKDWQMIFCHGPRELNRVADALTKMGISGSSTGSFEDLC
ncbi:hypothetical protein QN277_005898 [Acacia crassicarpa]|uniref:RNase H type-1 domain-containing protein n=1 Tax=Acacia crassicarpa TaxID=499986 RepID=A0AAE1MA79_9FABA|nr:hypothetical protein QN277_005898 [Acacia crassicarpa]